MPIVNLGAFFKFACKKHEETDTSTIIDMEQIDRQLQTCKAPAQESMRTKYVAIDAFIFNDYRLMNKVFNFVFLID